MLNSKEEERKQKSLEAEKNLILVFQEDKLILFLEVAPVVILEDSWSYPGGLLRKLS